MHLVQTIGRLAAFALVPWLIAATALASCPGPTVSREPLLWRASLGSGEVGVTYLGHSSFLIRSAQDVTAVTDFNGVHRPRFAPDVVTMNNAHTTHYTDHPDPQIKHVLRGWDPGGGMAVHDVSYKDMH